MSWEGAAIFIGCLIGGPLVLAAVFVLSALSIVCAVPVGVAWAMTAMVRPQVVVGMRRIVKRKEEKA